MSHTPKKKNGSQKHSGSVLILALFLTSLFLAIGLSIARINVLEHTASSDVARSAVAYQEAESGMEIVLGKIYGKTLNYEPNARFDSILGSDYQCHSSDHLIHFAEASTGASLMIGLYDHVTEANPAGDLLPCDTTKFSPPSPDAVPPANVTDTTTATASDALRNKIEKVKVWGIYQNTVRSIETRIVGGEHVTP